MTALVLVDRLLAAHPTLSLCTLNAHRVLLAALVVAVKLGDDLAIRAKAFAVIGGLPTQADIVRIEAVFLNLLQFRVFVSTTQYARKLAQLQSI